MTPRRALLRALRWLLFPLVWAAQATGALAFVVGLIVSGAWAVVSQRARRRWRRWLREARGETADTWTASAPAPAVELIARLPEGTPQMIVATRHPIRASHRDAQREVHAYAERLAGRPLSWKAARKLLKARQRAGAIPV